MEKDKTDHKSSKWILLQLRPKKTKIEKFVFTFVFYEL